MLWGGIQSWTRKSQAWRFPSSAQGCSTIHSELERSKKRRKKNYIKILHQEPISFCCSTEQSCLRTHSWKAGAETGRAKKAAENFNGLWNSIEIDGGESETFNSPPSVKPTWWTHRQVHGPKNVGTHFPLTHISMTPTEPWRRRWDPHTFICKYFNSSRLFFFFSHWKLYHKPIFGENVNTLLWPAPSMSLEYWKLHSAFQLQLEQELKKPSLLFEMTLSKLFAADVLFQHGSFLLWSLSLMNNRKILLTGVYFSINSKISFCRIFSQLSRRWKERQYYD